MSKRSLLTLAVVAALGAGAYGLYQMDRDTPAEDVADDNGSPSSAPLTSPIDQLPETVSVTLEVDAGDGATTYDVDVEGGETAFDALQTAAEANDFTVEYSNSEYGVFLTAVGGVSSDTAGGRYWIWYLNGESANAAMDQVVLDAGDAVRVSYEALQ
jgi:hypothetical protein